MAKNKKTLKGSDMTKKPRILIAGAGLGGLTTALALLKKGFDVDVYEQVPELKEVGAGVQIASNGTRVLEELGLSSELLHIGTELTSKEMRLWNTGRTWNLVDLGQSSIEKYGAPYYTLHRADLHGLLVDAVRREKPDAIHLNAKASRFEQTADGVVLHFEDGKCAVGDLLVGADGVHSKIRQGLFGPDKAKFTGCMAWRGLVNTKDLPDRITRTSAMIWLGPAAHIVHYPVRRGEYLNFFAVVKRDDWQVESWNERGSTEECLGDFKGWHDDALEIVRRIDIPYKWALITREPLPYWTQGRVTLLGDASHSMLPLLAQGANMAIEDGFVLARCLEKHAGDLQTGLKSYEQVRIERTTKMVNSSGEQANKITNSALADPNLAEEDLVREWEKKRFSYDWAYRYNALNVEIA
jgi:salicylate hydroxylase